SADGLPFQSCANAPPIRFWCQVKLRGRFSPGTTEGPIRAAKPACGGIWPRRVGPAIWMARKPSRWPRLSGLCVRSPVAVQPFTRRALDDVVAAERAGKDPGQHRPRVAALLVNEFVEGLLPKIE